MFDKIKAARAAKREAKGFVKEAAKIEAAAFREEVECRHYWLFFFIETAPNSKTYQNFQIGWPGEMKLTKSRVNEAIMAAKTGGMRKPILTSVTYTGRMMIRVRSR